MRSRLGDVAAGGWPQRLWWAGTYVLVGVVAFLLASRVDLSERASTWTSQYEHLQIDELRYVFIALVVWGVYLQRRRRRRLLALLRHQARTDPLTGLPNRTVLVDHVQQAVARARRGVSGSALIFLDLDGFKSVNDRFGHNAGDRLLCEVALRLQDTLREVDTVARLGGDEFVVLCEAVTSEDQVRRVIERLDALFDEPFVVARQQIRIGASCGVELIDADPPGDASELLRRADLAMYGQKRLRASQVSG